MKNNINISLRREELEALKKEFPDMTPGVAAKCLIRKQIAFIITKQIREGNDIPLNSWRDRKREQWEEEEAKNYEEMQKEQEQWSKSLEETIQIAKTKWIDD